MAHPPDAALTRALSAAFRQLREQGWRTERIAEALGVTPPTISRWETGARQPALDLLPRIDALLNRTRGHVLRVAGYVVDPPGEVRPSSTPPPN